MNMRTCSEPDCYAWASSSGLCKNHRKKKQEERAEMKTCERCRGEDGIEQPGKVILCPRVSRARAYRGQEKA